jgi:uncharacterized protein (DUF433 family)
LVEHATENRSVGGSIPPPGTIFEQLVVSPSATRRAFVARPPSRGVIYRHETADHLVQPRHHGRLRRVSRHESSGADLARYLEAGESIDDFLEGFPSVTREQVIAFLEEAKARMVDAAS